MSDSDSDSETIHYPFDEISEISESQYEIFTADRFGTSLVSNLIGDEDYSGLLRLLEEKGLLEILGVNAESKSKHILKNIILLTCSDAFKQHVDYKSNAKYIYGSASHKLFIKGNLDGEVFLAGNEILDMSYS